MARPMFAVDECLSLLAEGPRQIAALTATLAPEQLHMPPAPDEWPFVEILAHLRACADMWGKAIATILAEEKPTLRAINPRTWARSTGYGVQPFATSLEAFTRQREELLAVLQGLDAEAWARTGVVTGAGAPLERSVYFYAQWLARHERTHIKHIGRLVKATNQRS